MVYRKIKSTEVQFLTFLKKVIILYLLRKFTESSGISSFFIRIWSTASLPFIWSDCLEDSKSKNIIQHHLNPDEQICFNSLGNLSERSTADFREVENVLLST